MFNNATSADPVMTSWNFSNVTDMTNMFTGLTLSTTKYSNLLIKIESESSQTGVTLAGGSSLYNPGGGVARAALIADHTWAITDGGAE